MVGSGKFIPVNEPVLDGNEKAYLAECIDSGWISSDGPFVKRLEDGIAKRLSRDFGVAVCNGTAALEVAVAALGLGPGDEVILPSFTIISCALAIVRVGALPVLVDADPVTWNMNVELLESVITSRTKAIMAVHLYGLPVDMDPLLSIARKYGLWIIEDAAEAIGQTYRGRPCGSFGDISILSFYPNKHVTTGEGGMVLTNESSLAARAQDLRNLCFGKEYRFKHDELGWNFRMSNLQAAVGVAQLERLEQTLEKKRLIGGWYEELLSGVSGIQRAPARIPSADNIWWVYGVVLADSVSFDAASAMSMLATRGIGTRPFFWPIHEQPIFRRLGMFQNVRCSVAERIGRRGFYLPSGVGLTYMQAETVAKELRALLQ
jgi:perosamine synthetase